MQTAATSVSKRTIFVWIFLNLAAGILPILYLYLFKGLINVALILLKGDPLNYRLVLWIVPFLITKLGSSVAGPLIVWLNLGIMTDIKDSLNAMLISKTGKLSLEQYESNRTYNIIKRAHEGVERHLEWIVTDLPNFVASWIAILSLVSYIMAINVVIPVIMGLATIPIIVIDNKFGRKRWRLKSDQSESVRKMEYIESVLVCKQSGAEVRIFGTRTYFLALWSDLFRSISSAKVQLVKQSFLTSMLGQLNTPLTAFLVIAASTFFILEGRLSIGDLSAFIIAIELFAVAIFQFLTAATQIYNESRFLADVVRLQEMDCNEADVGAGRRKKSLSDPDLLSDHSLIVMNNVSFRYPGADHDAIRNINLQLRKGECVALVGPNGSGKSTIAKLMLGLFESTAGTITVWGVGNANSHGPVSGILQDFVLFELTVRENIGFGDLSLAFNREAVATAAAKGNIAGFIAVKNGGIDGILGNSYGQRGIELSGGERQRLAISRAFYGQHPVLILDEPTASLDPRAEATLYYEFHQLTKHSTVLLVSHRLGAVKCADRIIVLDEGQIIEEGTHDELILRNGMYLRMFNAQASWYL